MPRNPYMGGITVGDLVGVSQQRSQSVMPRRPAVPQRRMQADAIRTTVDFKPSPMIRTPGRGRMR